MCVNMCPFLRSSFAGRSELSFYTVPEYTVLKEGHANGKGWNAKYYKVSRRVLSLC